MFIRFRFKNGTNFHAQVVAKFLSGAVYDKVMADREIKSILLKGSFIGDADRIKEEKKYIESVLKKEFSNYVKSNSMASSIDTSGLTITFPTYIRVGDEGYSVVYWFPATGTYIIK